MSFCPITGDVLNNSLVTILLTTFLSNKVSFPLGN